MNTTRTGNPMKEWKRVKAIAFVVVVLLAGVTFAEGNNSVENGTFDASGADGEPVGWMKARSTFRYEKGAGRNYTRALAFEVGDPKQYDFPAQMLKLEAGKRYRVSGWIRTENLTGGAGARFGIEFADAKGNPLPPSTYASAVSGTSDGWQFVTKDVDVLTNAAACSLVTFVTRGCTGKAWFDDLSVVPAERPLLGAFVSSAYRDRAKDGEVTFAVTVRADAKTVADREITVKFRLPNGKTSWNERMASVTDGVARLTVPVESLPMGKHPVQAFVTAKEQANGREFAEIMFERVKEFPAKGSRIDEQGRLIVDGEPFFPFGMYMYGDITRKEMFDQYATGPFNCAMNWHTANPQMLDEYHKRGIKVIGCIKDAFCGCVWPPAIIKCAEDESAYVADKVAAVKDHPALIAWYANDEMGVDWVDRLKKRRALLHELDPDHPVWAVQYQVHDYLEYAGTYDIAGTDPYPIERKPKGDDIAMPAKWTRLTRQRALNTRALWQVPQYFDMAAFGKPKWPTTAPTEAELSCMIWQCIAEGANGIVLYAYHPLVRMDKKEPFKKKWAEACRVGKEVRNRFGLLLSDDATAEVKVVRSTPDVSVRAWRMNGVLWILAVNASYKPGSATVKAEDRAYTFELKALGHEFRDVSSGKR